MVFLLPYLHLPCLHSCMCYLHDQMLHWGKCERVLTCCSHQCFCLHLDIDILYGCHMYSTCTHKTGLVNAHRSHLVQQMCLFARFPVKRRPESKSVCHGKWYSPCTKWGQSVESELVPRENIMVMTMDQAEAGVAWTLYLHSWEECLRQGSDSQEYKSVADNCTEK